MKRFKDLTFEELKEIVSRDKKLREKFNDYIQTTEMLWIEDKLSCIEDSLSNWSIGFYSQNFLSVKDYEIFVFGVEKSVQMFGASEKLTKKLSQCLKLLRTNLFEFHAKQLAKLYMEEEIQSTCDYVEDCSQELFYGEIGEKSIGYLDCFMLNYDDYLYDEETQTYYEPHKVSA